MTNTVLPLVDRVNRNYQWCWGAEAQQAADLRVLERDYVPREKVKALVEVLRNIANTPEQDVEWGTPYFWWDSARKALAQPGVGEKL